MTGAYSPPSGTGTALSYTLDPKHRFVVAGTYEVPWGRGKALGASMSPVLNAVIGGWQLSGTWIRSSGALLNSGTMTAPASAKKIGQVGSGNYWFEVTGFAVQPAFTRRTNPWYYDGLTGPGWSNVDFALAKRVRIRERYKVEVRLEAYSALNGMNWANPNLTVSASDFGRTNAQSAGYYGRQVLYSAKLFF
jgi:hypothetical protein